MFGPGDKVTLFGRFRLVARPEIERRVAGHGVATVKDLTQRTTTFVVGSGAVNLIAGGALPKRLAEAAKRGIPVIGERRLLAVLQGAPNDHATVPVSRAASGVSAGLVRLLNAFDLIALAQDAVRFEDADALRNAAELEARGLEPQRIVEALMRRRGAPRGRHRLVVDDEGRAVLEWDDGVTTLSGQGVLALEGNESLDELFEAALEAEAAGDLEAAARHYESCARADRRDPVALYNLGNVFSALGDSVGARLAFERAIARDPEFAEAHFNLAGLLEAKGDQEAAAAQLRQALRAAPDYADAIFNLAQLELAAGDLDGSEAHFRHYIDLSGAGDWLEKAHKALRLIDLRRADTGSARK